MEIIVFLAALLFGTTFGSFAGAQVWRERARHVEEDKQAGEEYDVKEYNKLKPLLGKKVKCDRSQCLACHHELKWYDLLPIVSWLSLKGRCRYCKEPIGRTEIILESTLGLIFVLSVVLWPSSLLSPIELIKLLMWLIALVCLTINFVYDLKWSMLITKYNRLLIAAGLIFALLSIYQSADWLMMAASVAGSVLILGGLYALLWRISGGRWVGEGDIYLGVGIALFLSDWRLAFIALFAANLIGTLIVLPGMQTGRLKRDSQVPFGPLLIIGGLIAWFAGDLIINWYLSLVF